jgi:mono/diheme cytochrome c family protein
MIGVGDLVNRTLDPSRRPIGPCSIVSRALGAAVSVLALVGFALAPIPGRAAEPAPRDSSQAEHQGHGTTHDHPTSDAPHAHEHVAPPPAYARRHAPIRAWTDAHTITRGKTIYESKCAVCHGERGDGKGSGAAALTLKPPDLTDATMVAHVSDSYWFWRVSEGGTVQPFKSQGSPMPAWKGVLRVQERWAVIAYEHTFSGHHGPHVPAEHPEMADGQQPLHGGAHDHQHTGQPASPGHPH